ncbi:IS66 family insertion sequence element accessory protein TnpB, partial [Pseudoalteromonas maricaloris]|uniref:IS66 family insertion sequence element accessory protein TnpB n=1 Tax=Pseudoalteromonas maricaloris TaxID=184924 RepID=UPI001930CDAD
MKQKPNHRTTRGIGGCQLNTFDALKPKKLYKSRQPVDFRKSINGLAAIVEQEMAAHAMSGQVF